MQAPAERPSRSSERSTPKSRGPEDGPDHGLLADVAERPEILQRLLAEGVEALRGVGCLHRSLLIRQPVSEPTASSASTARLRQIPWAGRSRTHARRPQRYVA